MAPPPCSRISRRRRLGAEKRTGEIDREHPVPVRVGGLQQRREHRDAGIVDQRIEPAEARFGFRDMADATAAASERRNAAPAYCRASPIAATASRNVSPSISSSATRQPWLRNFFATASPMPRAAPVTSATFLISVVIRVHLCERLNGCYSVPRSSCPGRGAAFFMPLRRAGTLPTTGVRYGPGLAAHHAASAARCAASGAREQLKGCIHAHHRPP